MSTRLDRMLGITIAMHDARAKEHARERAEVIAALGLPPENGTAADRYAMTTCEFLRELARDRAKESAA